METDLKTRPEVRDAIEAELILSGVPARLAYAAAAAGITPGEIHRANQAGIDTVAYVSVRRLRFPEMGRDETLDCWERGWVTVENGRVVLDNRYAQARAAGLSHAEIVDLAARGGPGTPGVVRTPGGDRPTIPEGLVVWSDMVVWDTQLDQVRARFARMNRRLVRLGVREAELIVVPLGEFPVPVPGVAPEAAPQAPMSRVVVAGPPANAAGWVFAAVIDHEPARHGGRNVLRTVPGNPLDDETLEQWRDVDATCDHCGVTRLRRDTYLLVNGDGEVRHVGSTCLRDFLGLDPTRAVKLAELVMGEPVKVDEPDEATLIESWTVPVDRLLAAACAAERHDHGWVRGWNGTAAVAFTFAGQPDEQWAQWTDPSDQDTVNQVISWVLAQPDDVGGYLGNVRAVVLSGRVSRRNAGLVASAVRAWRRDHTQVTGTYHGTVGGKVTVERCELVKVARYRQTPPIPTRLLVVWRAGDGSEIVTWTGENTTLGRTVLNARVGTPMTVTGTVKGHRTVYGRPETDLTRVKVTVG